MSRTAEQVEEDFERKHGMRFNGWIKQRDKEWLIEFLQSADVSPIYPISSVVEIGVFMGSTSNIFLYLLPCAYLTGIDDLPCAYLTGIDDWSAGDHQAQPYFNLLKEGFEKQTGWSGRAEVITGNSADVGKNWTAPIDILHIDGDHAYGSAKEDIETFAPWVLSGGYMLIDNFDMEGVRQAIDERDWSEWDIIRVPDYKNEDEKLWAARRK